MARMPRTCASGLARSLLVAVVLPGCFGRSEMLVGALAPPEPFALDPTFAGDGILVLDLGGVDNLDWTPQGLDLLPSGKLLIAGQGGTPQNSDYVVVRLLEDGNLDDTFGSDGIATVDLGTDGDMAESVRAQADGTILVAGNDADGLLGQAGLARLRADGSPDTGFAQGVGWRLINVLVGGDRVNGLVPLADGSLRACGQGWPSGAAGQPSDFAVYALTAGGDLDPRFAGESAVTVDFFGGDEFGGCVPGGGDTVLVHGKTWGPRAFDAAVAKLLADGSLDPDFGDGSVGVGRIAIDIDGQSDYAGAVALQPDGRIVVAGGTEGTGFADLLIARLLPDGTLDPSFGNGGRTVLDLSSADGLNAAVALPDGRVACGGTVTNANGDTDFALLVLQSDGALDDASVLTFDVTPGRDDVIHGLAVDDAGRLVVFGATSDGNSNNFAVLRLRP